MRRRDFVTLPVSAAAAWSLVACAPSARPDHMVPSPPTTDFPADSPFHDAIFVNEIGGGEESTFRSNVGDQDFRQALQSTLQEYGLAAPDQAKAAWRLDAFLVDITRPQAGLSIVAHSFVRYTLARTDNGSVLFDDVVTASHKAGAFSEFFAPLRARNAVEGSIRANIAVFIERLKSLPPQKAANAPVMKAAPGGRT